MRFLISVSPHLQGQDTHYLELMTWAETDPKCQISSLLLIALCPD